LREIIHWGAQAFRRSLVPIEPVLQVQILGAYVGRPYPGSRLAASIRLVASIEQQNQGDQTEEQSGNRQPPNGTPRPDNLGKLWCGRIGRLRSFLAGRLVGPAGLQPSAQFGGISGYPPPSAAGHPMNWQAALGLPAFDSPFAAIQKRGYFLPGIQPPIGLRTAVDGPRVTIWFHRPEMARHDPRWHFARGVCDLI